MDTEDVGAFFAGFFVAGIISIIVMTICFAPITSETKREIISNIQQSTNIVEALKKEHLVIRDVNCGSDTDTVEITVTYDFLYKNSKMR